MSGVISDNQWLLISRVSLKFCHWAKDLWYFKRSKQKYRGYLSRQVVLRYHVSLLKGSDISRCQWNPRIYIKTMDLKDFNLWIQCKSADFLIEWGLSLPSSKVFLPKKEQWPISNQVNYVLFTIHINLFILLTLWRKNSRFSEIVFSMQMCLICLTFQRVRPLWLVNVYKYDLYQEI